MPFTFEWCDEGDVFEGRYDESVFAFDVGHAEGEFATATVEIMNPRVGLLSTGRARWAWIGWDDGGTAGPVALFFGRVVGIPESVTEDVASLQFMARSSDYDAQKAALAETLKQAPFWDPLWVNPSERSNPDVVLEARPVHWHIDRVTHELTVSDILAGEDGTITLPASAMYHDSLSLSFRDSPITSITCTLTVQWDQAAVGTIDLSGKIAAAFQAAGSPPGTASSFTGQGLQEDWPKKGDSIGGGWSVADAAAIRIDGTAYTSEYLGVQLAEARAGFPLWIFQPRFVAAYDVSRQRTETMTFTMGFDVQPLVVDAGEDATLTVSLSSDETASLIDDVAGTVASTAPIGDPRRRSYFLTDRGKQSLEYGIVLCRARGLARARAVQISRDIEFEQAIDLSCRKSLRIVDARLPGGEATGKVVAYSFGVSGETGVPFGRVTIACTLGRGGSVIGSLGDPVYAAAGYAEPGWQAYDGGATLVASSDVTYSDYSTTPILDDGLDLIGLNADNAVTSLTVLNGETAQQAALAGETFDDIGAAIEALNAIPTTVALALVQLTGGPFQSDFSVEVSDLKVPKTLDLETP